MEMTQPLPLQAQEAAQLFMPLLGSGEAVGLAVSGGADSMALALCAKAAGIPCRAFIVDHDLRPESGEEAALVKQRLEAIGIEAEILRWTHGPVPSRIHVEARKARYALLAEACRRHGLKTLMLAHHRDDQAETILMRLAKGSGVAGLAGMAAETFVAGLRLVRPFLGVPKAQLVALCEAQGVAFVTDPSNVKTKYARGRLRGAWDVLAQEGLTAERLVDLGERAGEAAQAVAFYADRLLRDSSALAPGGAIRLDLAAWRAAPRAVGMNALAQCLVALHQTDYAPERKQLLSFFAFLESGEKNRARTLHGCVAQTSGDGQKATLMREVLNITDRQPIAPGETVLWDGRWQVSLVLPPSSSWLRREDAPGNEGGEEGFEIRPLGSQSREVLDRLAPGLRHAVPQGRIRAALPALWRGDTLVAIPSFSLETQAVAWAKLAPLPWI